MDVADGNAACGHTSPLHVPKNVYPNVVTRRFSHLFMHMNTCLASCIMHVHGSTYHGYEVVLSFIDLELRRTIRFQLVTERGLYFVNLVAPRGTLEVFPSILP